MDPGVPEAIDVIARRVEFVEELADDPMYKAEMVESFDHSRSTVNRAVKELEDAGFVERVTEGYVTTQAGRLAARRYRTFVREERTVLDARDVLAEVGHEWDVPMAFVEGARVGTDDAAYRLFELLAEELAAADRVRLAVPGLPDSRYLRVCHSRIVEGDLAVTLQAPEGVLTGVAREFPHLWSELADDPAFEARSGETPPFGLVVSLDEDGARAVTLVATDGGEVAGFLHSDDAAAIRWGEEVYDSLEGSTADTPDDPLTAAVTDDLSPLTGGRLPAQLRSQGFVRVDDRYFGRREPMDPATAWRAGLDLPEVADGYAVERTREAGPDAGEAESLTDDLLDRLTGGEDVALVGPPGSGKSTVCKRVACRWREAVGGTVLYREHGGGQPFEAVVALEAAIERADGRALVVVEDAVRPEANAVFEVIRGFAGREDVTFLLDTRETEWRDPDEFPVDARLRAFRREAVETVAMPALDETDCRRLIDRVESVTDECIDVSAGDLLADLRRTVDDGTTPGVMSLLFHRLTRYLDPLSADVETTLDEDVDRVRRDLADVGGTALDAGVLVNLLNAAGLGVYPTYVHAVAGDDDAAHEEVREALDRLEGNVLFPDAGGAGAPYRAVHDRWSVRFLDRLLDEEGEAVAERRFGRCVTAVLSLADDAAVRETVAHWSDGDARGLDPVVAAPSEWADETVAAVFGVGREYPKLARLFGTTDGSHVALPTACSDAVAAHCTEWRGNMYARAGDLDRAESEFRDLETVAEAGTLPPAEADRARAESLLGHADVARRRGDTEAAVDHAREALAFARETDARHAAARARLALGGIFGDRGDLDRAESHLQACLGTFEAVDAPLWVARTLDELGTVAGDRGNYDEAVDRFERALDTYRSVGDRRGEATALANIGEVMNSRGDYEAAREKFLRALEVARELGDPSVEAEFLTLLGDTVNNQGDYDRAREHYREALDAAEAVGDRHGVARARRELGIVAGKRDAFDRARDHLREALDAYEAVGDRHGVARIHYNLGTVAGKQGDYDRAHERYRRALEGFEAVGNRHAIAGVHHNLGKVAENRGSYDEARDQFERALQGYEAVSDRHGVARTHLNLGRVARRRGAYDRATDQFEAARGGYEAVGDEHGLALVDRNRGAVALARGDHDRARDCFEAALERHESMDARHGIARAHLQFGTLARERGEYDEARDHCERALAVAEDADSPGDGARTRLELGRIALACDDPGRAEARAREARETFEDLEAAHDLAAARRLLGRAAAARDELADAEDHLEAALDTFETVGAFDDALETLSELVGTCPDGERARRWRRRAEAVLRDAPDPVADRHREWVDQCRTERKAD